MAARLPRIGGSLVEELAAIASLAGRAVTSALAALPQDVRDIRTRGARARQSSLVALAVVLSTCVACAMHLPDVWWAGMSGFMSTQATRPASVRKGALRAVGTLAGAALGVVAVSWVAYDPVACCLALLAVSAIGILGVLVSPHGYAWLFSAITFAFVVLPSLADPAGAFDIAVFRTLEVGIGTIVAMIVAIALAPDAKADAAPPPPGWTDLLGARWPAVLHALRSGIAVATLPLVWSWFYLPGLSTMAMTMASVLAVPTLADNPLDDGSVIVEKAIQRVLGCLVGGVLAVALLAVPLESLLPWLVALFGGVWLFAWVQSSTRGIGYLGTQAAIVFIIVLVQGDGPPASLGPAVNRLGGIVCGLLTLLAVCILVQPVEGDSPKGLTAGPELT